MQGFYHRIDSLYNFEQNYLNNGTGKACAGHNIVKLLLFITLKPLELSIEGNFGETRPTGSIGKTWSQDVYLNIGVGNACAGHNNVTQEL